MAVENWKVDGKDEEQGDNNKMDLRLVFWNCRTVRDNKRESKKIRFLR